MDPLIIILSIFIYLFYCGMTAFGIYKLVRGKKVFLYILAILIPFIGFIASFFKIKER